MHYIIWFLRVLLMVALSLATGAAGSFITQNAIPEWYGTLDKPDLMPPSWVFGVVWTILYVLMGIAAGIIWNIPVYRTKVRRAIGLFLIHLVLNFGWVAIFFGARLIGWAFLEILVLWAVVVVMEVLFFTQSKIAGVLLWPYIAWLTFAVYLNASIWHLNPQGL
jgi:tryptophan-rich sensory protein